MVLIARDYDLTNEWIGYPFEHTVKVEDLESNIELPKSDSKTGNEIIMEFLLWIVGIGLVLWLFEAARDSTYKEMVEDMQQTDEEVASRKAEIENQARLEKEEALSKARYALIDDPRHGTVTWAGRGRKPKWLVDYLAEGGSLSELEYPKKRVINSESFIIRVNEKLEEGNAPQGNFADCQRDKRCAG